MMIRPFNSLTELNDYLARIDRSAKLIIHRLLYSGTVVIETHHETLFDVNLIMFSARMSEVRDMINWEWLANGDVRLSMIPSGWQGWDS